MDKEEEEQQLCEFCQRDASSSPNGLCRHCDSLLHGVCEFLVPPPLACLTCGSPFFSQDPDFEDHCMAPFCVGCLSEFTGTSLSKEEDDDDGIVSFSVSRRHGLIPSPWTRRRREEQQQQQQLCEFCQRNASSSPNGLCRHCDSLLHGVCESLVPPSLVCLTCGSPFFSQHPDFEDHCMAPFCVGCLSEFNGTSLSKEDDDDEGIVSFSISPARCDTIAMDKEEEEQQLCEFCQRDASSSPNGLCRHCDSLLHGVCEFLVPPPLACLICGSPFFSQDPDFEDHCMAPFCVGCLSEFNGTSLSKEEEGVVGFSVSRGEIMDSR